MKKLVASMSGFNIEFNNQSGELIDERKPGSLLSQLPPSDPIKRLGRCTHDCGLVDLGSGSLGIHSGVLPLANYCALISVLILEFRKQLGTTYVLNNTCSQVASAF